MVGNGKNPGFFADLRRRRVFRLAGLYIVGAWIVIEVSSVFFPAWGIPDTALRYLFIAAALLFPVALVFSWIFDVTSEGIVRTRAAQPGEAVDLSLKGTDYGILAALAVIGVVVIYGSLTQIVEEVAEHPLTEAVVERIENSIAVLPFTNLDTNPDTGYFSDGITEEILHRLSATRALHVLARTSSFAFRSSEDGPAKISEILGVQYLLHGSVRRDADFVRVTARLIDQQGLQVWSQSFDRKLEAIFVIQSEIASAVASQIVREIVSTGGASEAYATEIFEAYDQYLVGREFTRSRTRDWPEKAEAAFRRALELDPDYAPALAGLAYSMVIMQSPDPDRWNEAVDAAERARQLAPNLGEAHAIWGVMHSEEAPEDVASTEQALRRAIELDPALSDAYNWLANILNRQGRREESFAIRLQGLEIDPLNPPLTFNTADDYLVRGQFDRAEHLLNRLRSLPDPPPAVFGLLSEAYYDWGRYAESFEVIGGYDTEVQWAKTYDALGMNEQAQPYVDELLDEDLSPRAISILLGRGQPDRALELIEAHDEKHGTNFSASSWSRFILAVHARVFAGHYRSAIDLFDTIFDGELGELAPGFYPDIPLSLIQSVAFALQQTSQTERASALLQHVEEQLGARTGETPGALKMQALNRVLRGDEDGALEFLQRAVDAGWADYYRAINDPRWGNTLEQPRFARLLARVQETLADQRAEVEALMANQEAPD